jgi:hypothetical protein
MGELKMQGILNFKYSKGQIVVRRPTAKDLFEAMSIGDKGNKVFSDTDYYVALILRCWDKGTDLNFLKELSIEEGQDFLIVCKKYFDNILSEDDIKKYIGQ